MHNPVRAGSVSRTKDYAWGWCAPDMLPDAGTVPEAWWLRRRNVQGEFHTLALRERRFQEHASPGTGNYTWMDCAWNFLSRKDSNGW